MQLVIGNKNYSSWSMRPWILLRHYGLSFEEIRVPLFVDGFQDELVKYSPTLRVPVLIDGDSQIWDSLAICEYLSEQHLGGAALPADPATRALCRSYNSEMHSGFVAIRTVLPMNCRATRKLELTDDVRAECARIDDLWCKARDAYQAEGDYLFGAFSMADCFFAPMVMRFRTYGIALSETSQQYMQTMLENEAVQQWRAEAEVETEVIEAGETGTE